MKIRPSANEELSIPLAVLLAHLAGHKPQEGLVFDGKGHLPEAWSISVRTVSRYRRRCRSWQTQNDIGDMSRFSVTSATSPGSSCCLPSIALRPCCMFILAYSHARILVDSHCAILMLLSCGAIRMSEANVTGGDIGGYACSVARRVGAFRGS